MAENGNVTRARNMTKKNRGSAYVMVVFISIPIFMGLLAAYAMSRTRIDLIPSYQAASGLYEVANSATIYAMLALEAAYLATREKAHEKSFADLGLQALENGSVTLPATYSKAFITNATALIQEELEKSHGQKGAVFSRSFKLTVDGEVFEGMSHISVKNEAFYFTTDVTCPGASGVRVTGIITWPTQLPNNADFQSFSIKNLDDFSPWVLELVRD